MEVLHLNIQEMILTLQKHWSNEGCVLLQSYDVEKGAGTMSPYTFCGALDLNLGKSLMWSRQDVLRTEDTGTTRTGFISTINSR